MKSCEIVLKSYKSLRNHRKSCEINENNMKSFEEWFCNHRKTYEIIENHKKTYKLL